MLAINNEYINWKSFLLHLAYPYPVPNQMQLMETLHMFKKIDTANTGYITRDDYEKVSSNCEIFRVKSRFAAVILFLAAISIHPIGLYLYTETNQNTEECDEKPFRLQSCVIRLEIFDKNVFIELVLYDTFV